MTEKDSKILKNKLDLLDFMLDDRCEMYGVRNTICYLLDYGLTKEEILNLKFDEEDLDYVIDNPNEEYDCK